MRTEPRQDLGSAPNEGEVYAHPMGWGWAFLGGFAYGSVVTSIVYVVWRVVTWSEPMHRFWPIFALLWLTCFSIVLLVEWAERDKIKKGALDLPGKLYGKRQYRDPKDSGGGR